MTLGSTSTRNLWWAAGYNLLAAGILAPVGFVLPMKAGAGAALIEEPYANLSAAVRRR